MTEHHDNEGLEVDLDAQRAAKAQRYQQNVPFGLNIWAFTALIALIAAAIVGGAVGGGLGTALANAKSDLNSCTRERSAPAECPTMDNTASEALQTPYIPRPASDVPEVALNCSRNKSDGTSFMIKMGYSFKWYCGVGATSGSEASEGGVIGDFVRIVAYSIEDCLTACATMIENDVQQGTGTECKSVVFNKNMSKEWESRSANCWLKNGTKPRGSDWGFVDDWYAYAERDN
ncbi:uncharacterized protein FOBCDRAFT_251945 [Fusarium oxysporum Fo47]|uniref:uncharacterized protein n=1 Tax=Fusarium oxysporum Fo47 TaxID=660027 RepID=UPI002869DDA2|nr:uncharacterized protein FOBCDRAFT_251945 [Fusarium oxysporum Fo47]QKD57806.2 hypothetical protein FOBCDRAFT_251945 [Fusarium oxysporum Fo47]